MVRNVKPLFLGVKPDVLLTMRQAAKQFPHGMSALPFTELTLRSFKEHILIRCYI